MIRFGLLFLAVLGVAGTASIYGLSQWAENFPHIYLGPK